MKDKIMAAAIALFARYGYKKTTVDDIAGELHMSKGNIYRYFRNKEDLYHQTVGSVLDGWRAYVQGEIEGLSDPLQKLRAMAMVAITYPERNPDFLQIALQDPAIFSVSEKRDNYRPVNKPAEDLLRSVLRQGIEAGVFREVDLDYTTELVFSIYMMHLIKIYGNGEGERGIHMYQFCIDLIVNGLKR